MDERNLTPSDRGTSLVEVAVVVASICLVALVGVAGAGISLSNSISENRRSLVGVGPLSATPGAGYIIKVQPPGGSTGGGGGDGGFRSLR